MTRIAALLLSLFAAASALADEPEIVDVAIKKIGMVWRIDVTLKHPDTGWDHYADGWEVLDSNGNRLAYRELLHPHVEEQPFTRSLSGIVFPDGTREVFIRAKCSQHGWSSTTTRVKLRP